MAKKVKMVPPLVYGALVDELGEIKAEISKLEERCSEIKEILVSSNQELIRGDLFQASISRGERCTLDSAKVRSFLTPKQVQLCERLTPFVTVRVNALTKG